MNAKKSSFDPNFMSRSARPGDIDEVRYIKMFANTSGTPAKPVVRQRQEPILIDMVNPQPKAFFAYLQMPPKPAKTSPATAKRVRRHRKVQ